jgi:hypothetical protein
MSEGLIAFQGEVELLNASWDLENGRMVEFRVCGEAYGRVHPFKKYQQRRGGRMGSRFKAAFGRVTTGELLMSCEVMLAAWKDSSAVGQSIKFWLDNEVEMHPFCGCVRRKNGTPGDVFTLVLVELNDDDTPVNQNQRDRAEGQLPRESGVGVQTGVLEPSATASGVQEGAEAGEQADRAPTGAPSGARKAASGGGKPRRFSSSVHLLVTSALYVQFLQETKPTLVKQWTPELARRYTKQVIKVESLSDLDRDPAAVKRFHDEIRRPYERWYRQEP